MKRYTDPMLYHLLKTSEFCMKVLNNCSIDSNDDFAFMAVSFCVKQNEHADSIVTLIENESNIDAALIARAMIEGGAILRWTSKNKTLRASRWRSFAAVLDYRIAMDRISSGEDIGDSQKNEIIDLIKSKAMCFVRNIPDKTINFKNDPFKKTWLIDDQYRSISTESLFEEAGYSDFYPHFDELSQWVHWGPAGIGAFMKLEDGAQEQRLNFNLRAEKYVGWIISLGCKALFDTSALLDLHLGLGIQSEIIRLKDELVAIVNEETIKSKSA